MNVSTGKVSTKPAGRKGWWLSQLSTQNVLSFCWIQDGAESKQQRIQYTYRFGSQPSTIEAIATAKPEIRHPMAFMKYQSNSYNSFFKKSLHVKRWIWIQRLPSGHVLHHFCENRSVVLSKQPETARCSKTRCCCNQLRRRFLRLALLLSGLLAQPWQRSAPSFADFGAVTSVVRPTAAPKVRVGPSVLAGDLSMLARETRRALKAGADFVHLDVFDGNWIKVGGEWELLLFWLRFWGPFLQFLGSLKVVATISWLREPSPLDPWCFGWRQGVVLSVGTIFFSRTSDNFWDLDFFTGGCFSRIVPTPPLDEHPRINRWQVCFGFPEITKL